MESSKVSDLNSWVQLYTNDLYSWAVYKLSNVENAKDVVQDTFLVAADKYESFKGESSPKTWLFSILNRKIIDHYRKKANHSVRLEDQSFSNFFDSGGDWHVNRKPATWNQENDKHLLDDNEFREVLKNCIDALPEKWSACVQMKYIKEKDRTEICQELEITPSNFWQIIHRAKLQLRDCVEKNWSDK